ncbi:DUF502 domain-containing protein [Kordiimonas lacus]|uniref:Uncharacterized membrane protein n=1 Tax=Kordiimonas lacus TaxID=637679 RepID=A0A1G6YB76_9PROT|nr:DUF502 domain-containing protein [Kordiimonas lacus]SDD86977.1 Uncharacterized membrane protein [Kordiimonas lacus]
MESENTSFLVQVRRNMLVGLFTLIPIWLTLLLINVILRFINDLAAPIIKWMTSGVNSDGNLYSIIKSPLFNTSLSVFVLLLLFYVVGWVASRYVGQKVLTLFEQTVDRIPVAKSIYRTIKRLADAVQSSSNDIERVVLIEFPSRDMKTVGLVTRTFKDTTTGRELAAVYVPTTPNPTSGYLEIVPVEYVTPTNWKMDEAMSFIISGGADVPKTFNYDKAPRQK